VPGEWFRDAARPILGLCSVYLSLARVRISEKWRPVPCLGLFRVPSLADLNIRWYTAMEFLSTRLKLRRDAVRGDTCRRPPTMSTY
jgi:hypothetical protein